MQREVYDKEVEVCLAFIPVADARLGTVTVTTYLNGHLLDRAIYNQRGEEQPA
jgi:hypothetical protein